MTTLVKTQKNVFSLEEIITILEHAFHEADAENRFENNCVFAVKPEIGQVIIQPKNSFCYDPILTEKALLERFDPERYELTVTCFMVLINKKIVR